MVNIYNKTIFLFSNIHYYADQSGSLFTASNSNPADWESGKSDMVLQSPQQSHLRQDPKEHPAPKQSDKAKGNTLTLHVNHSAEQGQNIQTPQNHIKYQNGKTVHCHLFAKTCILENEQSKAKSKEICS